MGVSVTNRINGTSSNLYQRSLQLTLVFVWRGRGCNRYFTASSVTFFFFFDNSVDITSVYEPSKTVLVLFFHSLCFIKEHEQGDHEETSMLVMVGLNLENTLYPQIALNTRVVVTEIGASFLFCRDSHWQTTVHQFIN